jgi:hypothetical protein
MTIDFHDDERNSLDSIRFNCEFSLNQIDEINLQQEKHDDPIVSAIPGISIDINEDEENARDSMCLNCEFGLNTIDESHSQKQKHSEPRISVA